MKAALGILRHILTTVGGGLTSKGVLGEDELQIIVGGVVTLAGVIWSVVDKRKKAE